MDIPSVIIQHEQAARLLLQKKGAVLIDFSEGTYQCEVIDKKKHSHWPLLQLSDEGILLDGFCSCSSEHEGCPHLSAAYFTIFDGQIEPLHVRFRHSLWNKLYQILALQYRCDVTEIKRTGSRYELFAPPHTPIWALTPKTKAAKTRFQELVVDRRKETEETSLKFSNLPPEELLLWKEGRPSDKLRYELSCWSDLAKWMTLMQTAEGVIQVKMEGPKGALPQWIHAIGASFSVRFYVAPAHWPALIPSLSSIPSDLKVHAFRDYKLQSLHYDVAQRSLRVEKTPRAAHTGPGIICGDWLFVSGEGFFPRHPNEAFAAAVIPQQDIASLLKRYSSLVREYLVDTPFHAQPQKVGHDLFFDAQHHLHLVCYVFEKGDLQQKDSVDFGAFVYLAEKGFYRLDGRLFEGVELILPAAQVGDFVNQHRIFLNGFEGFQTHVYRIESDLRYTVSPEGDLQFFSSVESVDSVEDLIDLGEWVYLKGKGFFSKKVGQGLSTLPSKRLLHAHEVGAFIRHRIEELEGVKGFFSSHSPIETAGIALSFEEDMRIHIQPHYTYRAEYTQERVQFFDEYTYVRGEGFCPIPAGKRLPEGYEKPLVLSTEDETYFVLYEIDRLAPFIVEMPLELKKPVTFSLLLEQFQKTGSDSDEEWIVEASLQTDVGTTDLFTLWHALQGGRHSLFSSAGCLTLRHPRFHFLKGITKKQWLDGGKRLCLSTLQWLKLSALEEVHVSDSSACSALSELTSFHTHHLPDLTGFRSDLRSYQEMGVRWLWFLYKHGLSGLLCDEMGLGKTHQAMGLIAGVYNAEPGPILIVCPTSVIYHWEQLLLQFLPHVPSLFFYGPARSLRTWKEGIILTSYGVLRSDEKALSEIEFAVTIFDELQIAKNARSQTHRSMKQLKAKMRLGLTGTPIENHLIELKALYDIILPGYFPQEAQFKELFVNPIEKEQDSEKKALLSRLIRPFILRRKKSEVLLELPEKIEEIAYCDLSEEQQALYSTVYAQHREALLSKIKDAGATLPYMHIFSLLSTLKQICDHPRLITKEGDPLEAHRSGKWDLFTELLDEIRDSGQKVVVFSQYLAMLDLIQTHLESKQIGYASVRGSTRDRKSELKRFREDPQCEVFVASLQAVGVGVDLVSASVVIHYDRWWNPARENQATDRVHRIGQSRGVQVFKFVTKGTIEEHIHRLIEKKKTLAEGIVGFDEQDAIKGLSRDELLLLLRQMEQDSN